MKLIFFLSIVSIKLFIALAYFTHRLSTGHVDLVSIGLSITILIVFVLVNLYLSYQVLFHWCDLNAFNKTIGAIGMFPLFYIGIVLLSISSIGYYLYNRMFDAI